MSKFERWWFDVDGNDPHRICGRRIRNANLIRCISIMALCLVGLFLLGTAAFSLGYYVSDLHHQVEYCSFVDPLPGAPYEVAKRTLGIDYDTYSVWWSTQRAWDAIEEWMRVLSAIGASHYRSPSTSPPSIDESYWRDCLDSDDFFRMYADPMCTYLWAIKIQNEKIVAIDSHIEPVGTHASHARGVPRYKPGENGGIGLRLQDGTRAYFKPCTGYRQTDSGESFKAEIIAFLLDRLLGVNRVPAIGLRYLKRDLINKLIAELPEEDQYEAQMGFDSIIEYCGRADGDGVEGITMGWAPFELELLLEDELEPILDDLFNMDELPEYYETLTSSTSAVEKRKPLESLSNLLYLSIIGYSRRFDHNMFFAKRRVPWESLQEQDRDPEDPYRESNYGPLTYIDNDRTTLFPPIVASNDKHATHLQCDAASSPVINVCRFPRSIARRILVLGQNFTTAYDPGMGFADGECAIEAPPGLDGPCEYTSEVSLGMLVAKVLRAFGDDGVVDNGSLFTCREAWGLDRSIQYWYGIISRCIAEHGDEAVLIDEPWVKEYHMFDIMKSFQSGHPY